MQYLSICFEEQCRLGNRQILCSKNDSQLHQSHHVELINSHSPFIRSLKTKPIKFYESIIKVHTQLQEQYEITVERVTSALKMCLQQYSRKIRDIYDLNEKGVNSKIIVPHLREKTPKTELWLTLINWKKAHPTEDMKRYIQDMPKTLIKEYKTTTNELVDYLASNLPKSSNKFQEERYKPNIEKLQAGVKEGSRLINEISKQIQHIYENSVKPKKIPLLSEFALAKNSKELREETLKQLAEVFCNSKSQLNYKDIGQSLRAKLKTKNVYRSHLSSIFRRVYNDISGYVINDLRYRGYDIYIIHTDLKNYRIWMQRNVADIFNRCVRFFMELDRRIVINVCEIYIIYVSIIIRMMEKTMKNNILPPCDSPAQRLERDVIYLYNHFQNFHKVTQLVIKRHHYAQLQSVKQSLKDTWKKIVVDTYALIKKKESIQNVEFLQLVFQEQDFCQQQCWGGIMQRYISYRMQGKLKQGERQGLEQSMKFFVNNGRALQRFINKGANPSLGDEIESLASFAVSGLKTMIEEKNQSLQCSSIAKREQFSKFQLNEYFINQQGLQLQPVLPH